MSMGTRKRRQRQEQHWVTHTELAAPGHSFYKRLSQLLDSEKFDGFCEQECAKFDADSNGRPSLTPGSYFRLLLVGYFEGIDSERGIAWRVADSLGLRQFLGLGPDEYTPVHSTISRARRLIDVDAHRKIFFWALGRLADRQLVKGRTVAIDATTLEVRCCGSRLDRASEQSPTISTIRDPGADKIVRDGKSLATWGGRCDPQFVRLAAFRVIIIGRFLGFH